MGHLRKTQLRSLANVATQSLMTLAAYNLVRLRKLLFLRPITAQAQGEVWPIRHCLTQASDWHFGQFIISLFPPNNMR